MDRPRPDRHRLARSRHSKGHGRWHRPLDRNLAENGAGRPVRAGRNHLGRRQPKDSRRSHRVRVAVFRPIQHGAAGQSHPEFTRGDRRGPQRPDPDADTREPHQPHPAAGVRQPGRVAADHCGERPGILGRLLLLRPGAAENAAGAHGAHQLILGRFDHSNLDERVRIARAGWIR